MYVKLAYGEVTIASFVRCELLRSPRREENQLLEMAEPVGYYWKEYYKGNNF
jgi:hypothetical protein